MGLERSGIPGEVVVWPDILYEGPTPLATGEEWIAARTGHLTSVADSTSDEIAERYRRNDAALESFRDHDEVIFWFEHDLFDQLLLVRHLWWLKERGAGQVGPAGAVQISLICRDVYLGPLEPEQFPPLFAERQPVTEAQIELGSRVWKAFCGADPTRLLPFAFASNASSPSTTASPELPFLAAALRRLLEEYPDAARGLSRTEAQILRAASDGPVSKEQAFLASTELEDAIFMGDLSFFNIVDALASAPHPLLTNDGRISVTATGRDVLAARADHIALNGINRWLGGVHLTDAGTWRWDGSRFRLVRRE
jgi:hypothetical protein